MTGLPLHELIGIVFAVPVLVHLVIARAWITHATRRLLRRADRRARVNYVLNAALFVLIVVEIVSGLVISQVALPLVGVRTINDRSWRALHNLALNWTLLVVSLHVAMNWGWIVSAIRRDSRQPETAGTARPLPAPTAGRTLRWIGLVVVAAGVIAAGALALLGWPSLTRVYVQDEIARFAPAAGHGLGQFSGEAFLVAVVSYVGRRWLGIRL